LYEIKIIKSTKDARKDVTNTFVVGFFTSWFGVIGVCIVFIITGTKFFFNKLTDKTLDMQEIKIVKKDRDKRLEGRLTLDED